MRRPSPARIHRHSRACGRPHPPSFPRRREPPSTVIPAQAGIPIRRHSRAGGNPHPPSFPRRRESPSTVIPAQAGIPIRRHSRAGGNPEHLFSRHARERLAAGRLDSSPVVYKSLAPAELALTSSRGSHEPPILKDSRTQENVI